MSINVINRRGEIVPLRMETISKRLNDLAAMHPRLSISTDVIAVKTVSSLVDGIHTSDIDRISANICASLIIEDHEYDDLAARITISDLHKNTSSGLVKYATDLVSYQYRTTTIKIMHPKVVAFIKKYSHELQNAINYDRDYLNNYFGAITLIKSYLLSYKYDGDVKITKERPQQMLLRVAIGINLDSISEDGSASKATIESIITTYDLLSDRYYTHATPTLFNAGTINHTLSSCYLLSIDDNLDNIYSRLTDISKISKFSGGVGIHLSQVRASGTVIASTIGRSEGLVPLMRVFNESTRYVSQGGGKRKGSTAVYIEPWHADIESVILSQKQQGSPERLCRDLFLALWVPDIFMERLKVALKTNKPVMWSLMCPHECPGLTDTYGAEFDELYLSYESKKMYRKQISIKTLWDMVMTTQIETGKPYLMYKDHVNKKCNQNNLGVIKSSNLCVAGNTPILTERGYIEIKNVAGKNVRVWNGTEWSESPVRQTNSGQKLVRVIMSDGSYLDCTEYHKFSILNEYGEYVDCDAKDLKEGDVSQRVEHYPVVMTDSDSLIAESGVQNLDSDTIPFNFRIFARLVWLSRQFDKNAGCMQITSEDIEWLRNIKLLANTVGTSPFITTSPKGYHLRFCTNDAAFLVNELLTPTQKNLSNYKFVPLPTLRVESVTELEGSHDTFCFNEPVRHMGVFNGVYAKNCVDIDTKILTDKGYVRIGDVAGQTVKIWDTKQFIDAPVRKTGTDQKLLKVITDDGCELKCTEYHRFAVLKGSGTDIGRSYKETIKQARELKTGDVLTKVELPVIEGNVSEDIKYPYTHGFYCGDGTDYNKSDGSRKQAVVDLYHGKRSLLEQIDYHHAVSYNESAKRQRLVLHQDTAPKYTVPINATIANKIQWLAGFLDADGTLVETSHKSQLIQAGSIHKDFLYDVKLMCNTLGLNPKIKLNKVASKKMMPDNKGLGNFKEYECKAIYRLMFTTFDTAKLYELGMKTFRLSFNGVTANSTGGSRYVRIQSVEDIEGLHDTYCFRSPETEKGIFNGLVSLNCSEITIYSDTENIGVCNLASICLPKFVKSKNGEMYFDYKHLGEVMHKVTINMNKVMDNNKYPLEQAKNSDDKNRPIGIGIQGLAEVFMLMKTPFDSLIAIDINKKIFETMYYHGLVASNQLAQVHGSYESFDTSMTAAGMLQFDLWNVKPSDMWDWDSLKGDIKNHGLRNSLLMALMPTAGTSIISGHTEGSEPPQSNIFTRSTLSGRFQVVNKHLVKTLKSIGLWTKRIRNKIIENDGSVQDIQEIPSQIRDVFKTVYEYKLTSLIKMNADREAYVCQASSNNRYLTSPDIGLLTKMHLFTWKQGLKCSSYYCRIKQLKTGAKLLDKSEEQEECLSCTA